MLKKIVEGISQKLNSEFGDDYKIYTETMKQDFQKPCFFVHLINSKNTKQLGQRYSRENLFCIQYFPESDPNLPEASPKIGRYDMLDRLYLCMEHIEVDGNLQQGTGMHGEIADEVLHFFVNYNMIVKEFVAPETLYEESMGDRVLDVRTRR